MEGKEKSPIRKIEKLPLDYKQFQEDIAFYKICMEIESQTKYLDSKQEAMDYIFDSYMENLIDMTHLFERYEKIGPISFEYLNKKYESRLNEIGLTVEEIKSFETYKINRDEEEVEQNFDDKDKSDTHDYFLEKSLITVKDYKKFTEYLKNIKASDLDEQMISFINILLVDFIKGLKKEYSLDKPDERMDELMLSYRDIITEIERMDGYYKDPIFDRLPEFQDYVDAARGGYLREFRKESK